MKEDFSGWATKSGLKCSDGRTIMPGAFRDQDKMRVPLVWQHGHKNPENVLGHVILEHKDEGVYCRAFFNNSSAAKAAREAVIHKDINSLSIWANQLIERSKKVMHGAIKEVSLVLSGANPGALIENISIQHDDYDETLDDEVIIFTGELIHSSEGDEDDDEDETDDVSDDVSDDADDASDDTDDETDDDETDDSDDSDDDLGHGDMAEKTLKDIYDSLDSDQLDLLHFMIGEAVASVEHSDIDDNDDANNGEKDKGTMKHSNVFEGKGSSDVDDRKYLSHDDMESIVTEAGRTGSLKAAVEAYGIQHGITDIDTLFPDAKTITDVPEFRKRRTEWVNLLLESVRKSPIARIKTISADLTFEDARAKGYVKGTLKKEEFFPVVARVTTPTTIYKKQKLDRDDMIDITDFDVVAWLKGEMRIMLDEELARTILIGDGRDISHEDKINEQNIRPIAKDHELYCTTINVNISDASSSAMEIIDAIVANRKHYRGTGQPLMFTTETYISQFMLLRDSTGRKIYKNLDEVAAELRVSQIVPVEAMEEDPTTVAVIVNPIDYVLGADKGGQVSMFDDFDIDYNQYKYLIETRASGALVKLKSALVVKKVASNVTLLTPDAPTFNSNTGVVTIPSQTGVVYKNVAGDTLSSGAQTAIAAGATIVIYATPASASYAFNNNEDDQWDFTREAS